MAVEAVGGISGRQEGIQPIREEIERKFLVDNLPENLIRSYPCQEFLQGYVVIADDGTEVRVRRIGENKYFQAVKTGRGKVRQETEVELTAEQFEALWPATVGRRVEKTRYKIPHDSVVIEVDIYGGNLAGLVTAEVEFDSEEASVQFDPPEWLGRDVTDDGRYKNQSLAVQGIPD